MPRTENDPAVLEAARSETWVEIRDLVEAGRTIEAHARVIARGGYRPRWTRDAHPRSEPSASTLATVTLGRLALQVGAPRKGDALLVLARRADPTAADAAYFHHYVVLRRRGPYAALRYLRDLVEGPGRGALEAPYRAHLFAALARSLASLRDFERAREWMDRAIGEAPDDAWLRVANAYALESEDRLADAEAEADRGLALGPAMRFAYAAKAHFRELAGDAEGALACLEAGGPSTDNFWCQVDRGDLSVELGRPEAAVEAYARALETAPLAEREVRGTLDRRIARAAALAGDRARARAHAARLDDPWARRYAERLAGPPPSEPRILLPVPYVRQSHVTCAPATLASIAAFYGAPVDHDALAERICYAGTPTQLERSWAEDAGYVAREFDVTAGVARALLERGHPFTLVTRAELSSHLQAVVGHDPERGVLLVRDPGVPRLQELDLERLLASHRHLGPRGMTMVPRARAAELEGIVLPNADAWDLDFAFRKAMDAHDRVAAEHALGALRGRFPGHHLRELGEMIWAYRAGDAPRELALVEAVLARDAGAIGMLGRKGSLLADVASHDERLRWLESLGARAPLPVLQQRADALMADARRWPEADAILERILRAAPTLGAPYHVRADLFVLRGRPADALELYRIAACLEPTNEHFARAYFDCAARLGRAGPARDFLVARVERARGRSSEPARTLFQVYADEGRIGEGLDVLEALTRIRPSDGELLLECAGASLSIGRIEEAKRFLVEAEGRAAAEPWTVVAARVAHAEGATMRAMALYREAMALDPSSEAAVLELASVLDEEAGPSEVARHLEEAHARLPESRRILGALCERLRYEDRPRVERILRKHLERHPDDAWSRRELAMAVEDLGRPDEALALIDESLGWLPQDAVALAIRGTMRLRRGDSERAAADLRAALSIDVDMPAAVAELMSTARDAGEAGQELEFVLGRLSAQRSRGPGVEAYGRADRVLSRDEALARAERLAEAYPTLPEACILHATRLADAGRLAEAWARIVEATEALPHAVGLWGARGRIAYRRQDLEAEARALRRAVVLAPRNAALRADLAASIADGGDVEGAVALLQEGIALAPRDGELRGTLASLRHRAGDLGAAIETMKTAVQVAPGHDGNFRRLVEWLASLGRRDEAISLVRELLPARRGWAKVHFMLAEAMWSVAHVDEQVAALEEALRLHPRYFEAADLLAVVLCRAGRYDEALASCPPRQWKGPVPVALAGRRAWVLAERGSLDEAIRAMEAAVEAEPGYAFGLELLTRFYEQANDGEGRLRTAERWVREIPTSADAFAALGAARLARGSNELALAAFEAALSLAPGHFGAAHRAIELHLEAGAASKAELVLDGARLLLPRDARLELETLVAVRTGRVEEALSAFSELAVTTTSPARLARAVGSFERASRKRELRVGLESALVAPECHLPLEVAAHLGEVKASPLGGLFLVRRLDALGPAGLAAVGLAIEELGARKALVRVHLLRLLFGRALTRHDTLWGSLGYALCAIGAFSSCIAWMRDFHERTDARPWMLLNLVQSLWARRRVSEATEVGGHALELVPDSASTTHRQWVALGFALAGRIDRAERLLEVDRGLRLPPHEAIVRRAAEAAIVARRADADPEERAHVVAAMNDLATRLRAAGPDAPTEIVRAFAEVCRLAAPSLPLGARVRYWLARL